MTIDKSSFFQCPGYIAAQGFFRKKITGGFVGSGPASTTDPIEFTSAALAFEPVIVA
jgi:hypothetical protein